ncbi:MAG: type I DNA topoisomerase [Thermoanaerobaculum sp.]|nr:type I DNA topoisomerase [Thermoanaerobaculum sp.]
MGEKLVIVESPAKARTLTRYLGKDFRVVASVGHVRDLPKNELGIDLASGFEPKYEVLPGKRAVVAQLQKAASQAEKILVATDPDREGEAIGWHVAELLQVTGKPVERVLFHEITQQGVRQALQHPRSLDPYLVDSQKARRVLDRLVGYTLSPLLWEKVKRGLSAGRVQSVALKMICDREAEIAAFVPEEYWNLDAFLDAGLSPPFFARLALKKGKKFKITDQATATAIREELASLPFCVAKVRKKRRQQHAPPPFVTAKLQQAAYQRFRFPVRKTMQLAQRLYEGVDVGGERLGLITYMRTDSVRVATEAVEAVRAFIAKAFGAEALPEKPNTFKNRQAAQDAHEAIRPTDVTRTPETLREFLSPDELKLYTLIWQRFVASQMKPALFDVTEVLVEAGPYGLKAKGEVEVAPGFLQVYREEREPTAATAEEEPTGKLPPLEEGQQLRLLELKAEQKFTQPPPRYTESSLVKALEENGVGRPSTYAQIIATLADRNYVVKEKGAFVPTELGKLVTRLLTQSFGDLINEGYTARLEEELDAIAEGEKPWREAISAFWQAFSKDLDKAKTTMENAKAGVATEATCPTCGAPMVLRFGRFGEYLACSNYPTCKTTCEPDAGAEPPPPCPLCGAPMAKKRSRYGTFWACSRYPQCKGTQSVASKTVSPNTPSGVTCPECGQGELVEKRSRRGRPFWGCNRFPTCTFTLPRKPIPRPCPVCQAPFVLEKKTLRQVFWQCAQKSCHHRMTPEEG